MRATPTPPPPPKRAPVRASPYATWVQRGAAVIVDNLLLALPLLALPLTGGGRADTALVAAYLLANPVYFAVLNGGSRGQTVGKRALGIAVRDAEGRVRPIGVPRALARWAVMLVAGVVPAAGLLNLTWPLWDDRRQAWHDKVARSVVVKVPSPGAPAP
jgi:uncharacterized RDD family membrane protein YckC